MREILVMTSRTSVRPSAPTHCQGGGGKAGQPLGMGVFGHFFLVGKSRGSVAFGNPRFSGGKSLVTRYGIKGRKEHERRGDGI